MKILFMLSVQGAKIRRKIGILAMEDILASIYELNNPSIVLIKM